MSSKPIIRASPRAGTASGPAAVASLLLQRAPSMEFIQTYLSPVLNQLNAILGSSFLKVLKAVIFVVFVLNIRSWPFVWHVRIWRWAVLKRLDYRLFRWRTALYSPETRGKMEDKWVERSMKAMGVHPFEFVGTFKTWASLDESDFNMHLSNSSYGKTLDAARFKVAVEMFTPFFRGGGWIPLAATQFHFICEIPIGASYEVRSRIGGWDAKWFYIVSKFVLPASKSKKKRKPKKAVENGNGNANPDILPSLRTPSCADEVSSAGPSGTTTPLKDATINGSLAAQLVTAGIPVNTNGTVTPTKKVEDDEFDVEEPDGAQVHTVAVSRCCFKVGRITVPPAIVFALGGMSSEGATPGKEPKHWEKVKASTTSSKGRKSTYGTYDPRMINKLVKGGWREVEKDEDKWWERAFDSVKIENEQRVKRLEGRN